MLLRVLDAFTAATLARIRQIVGVLPVAKAVDSPDGTLFVVVHHGQSFPLSVVSACSGVNSVVGFLLIGSAFAAVVHGPIAAQGPVARRWNAPALWVINLGRITFIFWAGKMWGEHVAINILHPFIGLVTFSLGVLVMVALIRPLGMQIGAQPQPPGAHATRWPQGSARQKAALAVPKVYVAVILVTVAAVVLGISNLGLKTYNLVADASGEPKLAAYVTAAAAPQGWRTHRIAQYDWAKPLFGDTSIWDRYVLTATKGGDLHASVPVVADVILTPDLESFSAYGVEACYQFHGYSLRDVAQVDVGGGITGQAMSYSSQIYGSWSIVYWIIPVKVGAATSYERVVLYVEEFEPRRCRARHRQCDGYHRGRRLTGSLRCALDPEPCVSRSLRSRADPGGGEPRPAREERGRACSRQLARAYRVSPSSCRLPGLIERELRVTRRALTIADLFRPLSCRDEAER